MRVGYKRCLSSPSLAVFVPHPQQQQSSFTHSSHSLLSNLSNHSSTTFKMKFFVAASLLAVAFAAPAELDTRTDRPVCPNGLFSNPLCCATDVLGIACLDGGARTLLSASSQTQLTNMIPSNSRPDPPRWPRLPRHLRQEGPAGSLLCPPRCKSTQSSHAASLCNTNILLHRLARAFSAPPLSEPTKKCLIDLLVYSSLT